MRFPASRYDRVDVAFHLFQTLAECLLPTHCGHQLAMHNVNVAIKLSNFFKPQNWRAASALLGAMMAYDRGRYFAALTHWERVVQFERMRTSEHMTFYAVLMAMNKRPAKEGLAMFRRVVAGEFRRDHPDSRYAEALAHYWIAFQRAGHNRAMAACLQNQAQSRMGHATAYAPSESY